MGIQNIFHHLHDYKFKDILVRFMTRCSLRRSAPSSFQRNGNSTLIQQLRRGGGNIILTLF